MTPPSLLVKGKLRGGMRSWILSCLFSPRDPMMMMIDNLLGIRPCHRCRFLVGRYDEQRRQHEFSTSQVGSSTFELNRRK